MYRIFCDETLIYDSTLDDYIITKGLVSKELNKSGSFIFTIYASHPYYNSIQKLKSIITVYKASELIFRGRVINESIGFYKDKTFTCEGELGFLIDSVIRPYTFSGTPTELFEYLIAEHNSQVGPDKRFVVGTITVTDPNNYIARSNESYESTSDNLNSRLLDPLGGYIFITSNSSGDRVLNWYADSPYRSDQKIEFGENLLSFLRTNRTETVATALIPLGAESEDPETGEKSRLTIESVNEGVDYVYDADAVAVYGWIFAVETWNDITIASNLKSRAEAYLADRIRQTITIELTAIDLSLMDHNIDSFRLGDYIQIVSTPHNLDDEYLLEKQSIDLLKPDNDKITLGNTYSTFTGTSVSKNNQNDTLIKTVAVINSSYADTAVVNSEIETLKALIDQTSTAITSEVLADYVSNGELSSSLSTLYTQLNDLFEFKFTSLESTVNDQDTENRREFRKIEQYIRFEDGNIILGESGNELTVKIENDKISFLEGNLVVAYVSNQKLYITDAEILDSLKIGNYAFIPRANGNLSFKKLGG